MVKAERITPFPASKAKTTSPARNLRRPLKTTQLPLSTLATASSMPTILKHTAALQENLSSQNRPSSFPVVIRLYGVMNKATLRGRKHQIPSALPRTSQATIALLLRIPVGSSSSLNHPARRDRMAKYNGQNLDSQIEEPLKASIKDHGSHLGHATQNRLLSTSRALSPHIHQGRTPQSHSANTSQIPNRLPLTHLQGVVRLCPTAGIGRQTLLTVVGEQPNPPRLLRLRHSIDLKFGQPTSSMLHLHPPLMFPAEKIRRDPHNRRDGLHLLKIRHQIVPPGATLHPPPSQVHRPASSLSTFLHTGLQYPPYQWTVVLRQGGLTMAKTAVSLVFLLPKSSNRYVHLPLPIHSLSFLAVLARDLIPSPVYIANIHLQYATICEHWQHFSTGVENLLDMVQPE